MSVTTSVRELSANSILLRESQEITAIAATLNVLEHGSQTYLAKTVPDKYVHKATNLSAQNTIRLAINAHNIIFNGLHKPQVWWRRVFDEIDRLEEKSDLNSDTACGSISAAAGIFQIMATRVLAVENDFSLDIPGLPDCQITKKLGQLSRLEQCCLAARLARTPGFLPPERSEQWWANEINQACLMANAGGEQKAAATSLAIICS